MMINFENIIYSIRASRILPTTVYRGQHFSLTLSIAAVIIELLFLWQENILSTQTWAKLKYLKEKGGSTSCIF